MDELVESPKAQWEYCRFRLAEDVKGEKRTIFENGMTPLRYLILILAEKATTCKEGPEYMGKTMRMEAETGEAYFSYNIYLLKSSTRHILYHTMYEASQPRFYQRSRRSGTTMISKDDTT